jgi:hypothetical protein
MKTNTAVPNDKGFRFPPEGISHVVRLSFRFSLSFRDSEELLAQRGIVITSETVRQWCVKCGQTSANELRRHRPRWGDTWHRDEVYLKMMGKFAKSSNKVPFFLISSSCFRWSDKGWFTQTPWYILTMKQAQWP